MARGARKCAGYRQGTCMPGSTLAQAALPGCGWPARTSDASSLLCPAAAVAPACSMPRRFRYSSTCGMGPDPSGTHHCGLPGCCVSPAAQLQGVACHQQHSYRVLHVTSSTTTGGCVSPAAQLQGEQAMTWTCGDTWAAPTPGLWWIKLLPGHTWSKLLPGHSESNTRQTCSSGG